MSARRSIALLVSMTALLTACGRVTATTGTGPTSTPTGSPADATAAVLTVREGGGLAPEPPERSIPAVSLWADGRVIVPGAQVASWPAPALPSVQVLQVDPTALSRVLGTLRLDLAGLSDDFGLPPVTDAPSVEVVWRGDGVERRFEAYALGIADDTPGDLLTPAQVAARARLARVVDYAHALADGTLDSVQVTPVGPYAPDAWLVWARAFVPPSGGPTSTAVPWPGPVLTGAAGGAACQAVTGEQAAAVGAALAQATTGTPWLSGGGTWSVTVRPVLPGESPSCPA